MTDAVGMIALVGLPGAGKSTVGQLVATKLGRDFVDLDMEIERHAGRTVAQIFASDGEARFRELEREATAALADRVGILATGGGWMSNPGARALLRPTGHIIYLRVGTATALARMNQSVHSRPLLAHEEPEARLAHLLAEREPFYAMADAVVDTEAVGIEKVTEQVALLATRFLAR